jgi:heme exporter protein A
MTLSLNNLGFERNNQIVFHSVSSEILSGEMLQICGANGCGKSTLLRILAGYLEPQMGTVNWHGRSIVHAEDYQQQLHYLGHQNALKPRLSAYENLEFFCALIMFKSAKSVLISALQQVGLGHAIHTQAFYLSAGQARRLALARLLVSPAKLWLLDEPTTALDTEGQILLNNLLTQHMKKGGIVVAATHQNLIAEARTQRLELTQYGAINA